MVIALDRALRERVFQRLSDLAADTIGCSCYGIAAQCALASIAAVCARSAARAAIGPLGLCDWFVAFAWPPVAFTLYARAGRLERRWRADPASLPRLDDAMAAAVGRAVWFPLFAWDIMLLGLGVWSGQPPAETLYRLCDLAWSGAVLCHYYFLGCRPRLPRVKRAPALAMASAS